MYNIVATAAHLPLLIHLYNRISLTVFTITLILLDFLPVLKVCPLSKYHHCLEQHT